ncbi:hypothetical protein ACMHYO_12055 [Allopusillimonas ginsengisoli]|uniref:hypothetical protein n=1 Tax=Allopusillimonas ginsengisoli TaxID=453575 RepID=UPI0039C1CF34
MGTRDKPWNPPSLRPTAIGIYRRLLPSEYGANAVVFDFWNGSRWMSMGSRDSWCMQNLPWQAVAGHGEVITVPAPPHRM